MANGFGSLYIGTAGLKSSQNALNITANNLANVDTQGYVRQQVLFADRHYLTLNETTAISPQQSGLGVQIGDVVHTRDIFLDRSYRTESGRQAFYSATAEAAYEVETFFQELEGEAFQDALEDFWVSFQELAKAPDDNINQNLVVQKAQLFASRAQAVYSGLQSYQYNINTQIRDQINQINELGETIHELNKQIQKIEAGGVETAMTLRDARDQALDELSSLVDISYSEDAYGIVKVSVEGTEFVGETIFYEMGMRTDQITGFVTPYWEHLSDTDREKYVNVFNFNRDISTENKNDIGSLKALILARGDSIANYKDIEGLDVTTYEDTTGMSVMMRAEAQLDQLIHNIITAINDTLCPNTTAGEAISDLANGTAGTAITAYDAEGNAYEITASTKILDAENCSVGNDGKLPPQELFTRIGTERYTEVTYNGETYYVYNEEDANDTSKQYTIESIGINEALIIDEALLPHLTQNGSVNYDMASELSNIWEKECLVLNLTDNKAYSFKDYYSAMIGEMATFGEVYDSTANSLSGTVATVDNQRQQVFGVSSDEELTYMIKYQNAYNASSRFINVVNEMIEHLITQLG